MQNGSGKRPLIDASDLIDDSLDSTVSTSPVSTIQSPTNEEEQWGYEPPAASVWLIYFVSLSMR